MQPIGSFGGWQELICEDMDLLQMVQLFLSLGNSKALALGELEWLPGFLNQESSPSLIIEANRVVFAT